MRLANFEFDVRLYEGRSTLVYAGKRLADALPVVAKLVTASLRDLHRECALLQRVAGEGVAEAIGIFESSDGPVLVQRRFGDGTVEQLCARGPAPLAAALSVVHQLTGVLTRLHRARVLHRDIKPANILYEPATGRIALADFGIAVELPINARSVAVSDLVGTPAYIAPEQTGRLRGGCDARSDVYATGITLYQLLTGVLPFESNDMLEQIAAQLSKTPVAPDQLNPAVPKVLSAIVMKAIEKHPDARYQSAKGLGADLLRCLQALEAGQPVADFELGQSDVFQPRLPRELFGRADVLASLRAASARASAGRPQLVIVSGRIGTGRRQVVRALLDGAPELQFAQGQWQDGAERPLGALAQALTSAVERWLALDDAALSELRERALAAVGSVGQVLVEIAPELASVLGPQPELPALGPAQARARLRHAFRSFLAAIGGEQAALLALEDGEHADAASLDLIDALLGASEKTPVLVIVTVSSPEVLAELRERHGGALIELAGLTQPDVDAWTAATLQLPAETVQPLAAVLFEKSGGNPGLLVQLLEDLVDTGVLDREGGRFTWDLGRVRAARAPQNVSALLGARVRELPELQRMLLAALACHDGSAEPADLAAMLAESAEHTAALISALESAGLVASKQERVAIAHAGVSKAASELCSPELRRVLSARLVRHLLDTRSDAALGAQAALVARALHHAELPLQGADRRRAAGLYKLAAAQASGVLAYASAALYCEHGLALISRPPAPEERSLWLELTVGHARALMMQKDNARCEQLLADLCTHELSPDEIALVYQSRIDNMSNIMERERSVTIGLEGLARLGIELPSAPTPQEPFGLLQKNEARLAQLSQQQIMEYRALTDARARAAISILSNLMAPTGLSGRTLLWILEAEVAIQLVLDHGRERYTTSFLVAHAMILLAVLKNFAAARRWYATCDALETAAPVPELGARTFLVVGYYLSAWFDPPAKALQTLEKGLQLGTEAGDPLYAALCASAQVTVSMIAGTPLDRVLQVVESRAAILQGDGGAWANACNVRNLCQKLTRGEAIEPADLASITAVPVSAGAMRNNAMINFGIALSVCGHEAQVRAWLAEIGPSFPLVNAGQPHTANLRLLEGLFAAKDAQAGASERLEAAKKALEELRAFEAQTGATHHRPAILLLEAELARAAGEVDLAIGRYARAAAAARQLEMPQLVALVCERRCELLSSERMPDEAAVARQEAHLAYKRWGHMTRVQQLEAAHPELRSLSGASSQAGGGRTVAATHAATSGAGSTAINDALDLATVLRISQEISTELHAEGVVKKVLSGIVQNAGAERALWVQLDGGERVLAELHNGEYRSLNLTRGEYNELPESVARIVRRTKQPLVVADALSEANHKADPFVVASRCRSVACIPVSRKGELGGYVLLENRLIAGAFTPQLVSLTRALVAQAAISLDNASLYSDMEQRVRERTLALNERNEKMRLVLDNVSEGLFLVDREGKLASERSATLARFFPEGVPERIGGFFEHDPKLAGNFALNWDQLLEGFLPLELCIDQLPHALTRDGRSYELSWQPLCDASGELRSLLTVMRDVTDARKRAQAEQQQKQLMVMFEKILADQHGVAAFVQETERLIAEILRGSELTVEKRLLHTLKGNTAIFGLATFSHHCHEIENVLELEERGMSAEERAELQETWQSTRASFEHFLNAQSQGLQVALPAYEAALSRLRDERHPLAEELELWRLESARAQFERIAEQAQKLALRLDKAPLRVELVDNQIHFVDEVWTPFWSSFVHVVRNGLDHGLETPAEREALGKGPGTLRLCAKLSDAGFVLEFSDDGRGIAWERLRQKARSVGLPADTHDDLLAALFADGVSTKEEATELSGRGVGMAAVRDACESMKARIEVESTAGAGTTWRFTFPAELVRAPRALQARLQKSA